MEEKKNKANQNGNITFEDIVDKMTIEGQQVTIHPDALQLLKEVKTPTSNKALELAEVITITSKIVAENAGRVKIGELQEVLEEVRENLKPVGDLYEELETLEPFLTEELNKPEYVPEYEKALEEYTTSSPEHKNAARHKNMYEKVIHSFTAGDLLEMAQDPDSFFYKAMKAARTVKSLSLPALEPHSTEHLNTAVDKFNFLAFDNLKETEGQLQYKFDLMADKDKRNPKRKDLDISMAFSLTFESDPGIKTTKALEPYDQRVQQAVDTLYTLSEDEQPIFFINDVFHAMGGTGNPSPDQRDKINASLTKQGTARIYMDNLMETREYDYPHFVYDGNIIQFERIRGTYNNQEVAAIRINNRPAMMKFSDERDQMTKVPLKVLQSGIQKTDNNLRIENYLLYRITHRKNEINDLKKKKYTQERQKKIKELSKLVILLDTLYERTRATKKARTDKKVSQYLTHYQSCGYIKEFSITDEKITIKL